MACDVSFSIPFKYYAAASTANRFVAATDWFLVADAAKVSACLKANVVGTNMELLLAWQLAEVRPDDPDDATTSGTGITTVTTGVGRTATITGTGKMWVRLGFIYHLTTGSTEATLEASIDGTVHQCISLAGHRVVEQAPGLPAGSGIADAAIYILTGFEPTAGAPTFKGVVMGRDLTSPSDTRTVFLYRTANDKAKPGDWTLGELTWDTPAAEDDERNTGTMTPTVTDKAYIQWAFAVRRNTGGSTIQGDFEVLLARMT